MQNLSGVSRSKFNLKEVPREQRPKFSPHATGMEIPSAVYTELSATAIPFGGPNRLTLAPADSLRLAFSRKTISL